MICPLLSITLFRYQKISGKQKGYFTKLFVSVLWDKKFPQNRDAPPPSYAWTFSSKEFFWNTKVLSNSPLLCLKIFDTRILSKHRRVLLRILSALWDKDFSTEFSDIPFLCRNFSLPEIFWFTEVFPNEIYRYSETKSFERKVVIPPSFA